MKIICQTPPSRETERAYAFSIFLGEWLGLEWEHCVSDIDHVRLSISGDKHELVLPDTFFSTADTDWLGLNSLPQTPMAIWDTSELGNDLPLTKPTVPVIFGDAAAVISLSASSIRIPIDIFGSAFFMLTRYEELVLPDRDIYDRFPSSASIARRAGFLERPIIDEYLEILWAAMLQLWPGITRRDRSFKILLSHDVDRPSRYAFATPKKLLRRLMGDMLVRRQMTSAIHAARVRFSSSKTLHYDDPANTFDWIMEQSEKHGIRSAFYFICGRTNPTMDADYEIKHPAIRDLLRRIYARGHEIGLHPSFETYLLPDMLTSEFNSLRRVCGEEGILQDEWGGRMHYLRWRHPVTLKAWDEAGLDYDSTLGYAEHAGFRCGTCHEFRSFDLLRGIAIRLRTRPLIAMDVTIMAMQYMNLGVGDEAFNYLNQLKNACRIVKGNFTLLWHNSELDSLDKRSLYMRIVSAEPELIC